MRHKSRSLGFLFSFPHAVAFKGGGAPAMPAATPYTPPTPYVPPGGAGSGDLNSNLQSYLAGSNSGYYDEFVRNRDQPDSGDSRDFSTWLRDHLTATPDDALWGDTAIATWAGGGDFVMPDAKTDQPPEPPAPDAPVTSPNGTTVSQPNPYTPPPPVSDRSSEVMQAGREARRNSKKRKGLLSTYLAGETGGAQGSAPTLLGRSGP